MKFMGAEALVYSDKGSLVKKRVRKSYRIPELDNRLRKQRTTLESRVLSKASRAGIPVPRVLESGEFEIRMELLEGKRAKESLSSMSKPRRIEIYKEIGEAVAKLHSAGIMHGDLTTSNMIIRPGKARPRLCLIDFGLAKHSARPEDQAVDLFLLSEALKAAHFPIHEEAWQWVLKVYKRKYSNSSKVLSQLEKIKQRRRYK